MLKAQESLNGVFSALSDLECGYTNWKPLWVSVVTGLRSTGHVLHKVDSKISEAAKTAIEKRFRSWKEDEEGWYNTFIEPTRNALLKEGAGMPSSNIRAYGDENDIIVLNLALEDTGDDAIYVAKQAANWLQNELDDLSREIFDGA